MAKAKPRTLTIEDVSTVRRPKLGPNYPVSFWRMMALVAMPDVLGAESPKVAYLLGYSIGKAIDAKNGQDIADALLGAGIGVPSPVDEKPGFLGIEFSECFTCSGITPPVGGAICHFAVGFVAGAIEIGMRKKIGKITETKCGGGLGHDVCRIEAEFS